MKGRLAKLGCPYLGDNEHLFWPSGVTTDAAGNVYVTESKGHRMMKFGTDGGVPDVDRPSWRAGWRSTSRLGTPQHLAPRRRRQPVDRGRGEPR